MYKLITRPRRRGSPALGSEAIVLGIDPGIKEMGYGVVARRRGEIRCLEYGIVQFGGPGMPSYPAVSRSITKLLQKYHPGTVAIETLYAQKNLKWALAMAETRGVMVLACQKAGLDIKNIPPAAVKRIIAGHGRATKAEVSKMVRLILNMDEVPEPDDAADALALAIAAAFGYKDLGTNFQSAEGGAENLSTKSLPR